MALLTALDPEPGTGGIRLQVDGTPFATVALGDVAELGLREGQTLDPRVRATLVARAELFSARSMALRALANRPLPARELVRRLTRKGQPKPLAETAVAVLVDAGLVNDAEFARHYVRTRVRRRVGFSRLVAELRRLGVEEATATLAVRETLDAEGVDERGLVREAAERKLRSLGGLDRQQRRRRLRAYLLRRGFARAEIGEVMRGVA